jgi:chromate transport protein ChrA
VVSGIAFFNRFFLRDIPGMAGFISGVWAAIFAFMGSTVFSLTKKTLRDPFLIAISAVSIGLILVFKLNFLFIILLGGSTFVAVHFFRTLPTFNPKAALAEPGEPT